MKYQCVIDFLAYLWRIGIENNVTYSHEIVRSEHGHNLIFGVTYNNNTQTGNIDLNSELVPQMLDKAVIDIKENLFYGKG